MGLLKELAQSEAEESLTTQKLKRASAFLKKRYKLGKAKVTPEQERQTSYVFGWTRHHNICPACTHKRLTTDK